MRPRLVSARPPARPAAERARQAACDVAFAVEHLPRAVALDMTMWEAAGYALAIALFAAALGVAYLATGNLWFCVLVHALTNLRPTPWPAPRPLLDPYPLIAMVVAIAWTLARRRRRHAHASR